MAKDINKAEMLEFTKSDVTLYPDNQKPGKIRIKWKIFTWICKILIYTCFASNGSNYERRLS